AKGGRREATMNNSTMAVLPVGDRAVFPGTETTLEVKGAAVDRLFSELRKTKNARVALRMREGDTLAIAAELTKIVRLPDERYLVTVRALERVTLGVVVKTEPYEEVSVTPAPEDVGDSETTDALAARVHALWAELHEDEELAEAASPSALAD